MHQHHDPHAHRELEAVEEPLDAANQSLSDALKSSFGILKGIMLILVILYFVSNVGGIGSHEEALVLRLGALRPGVHDAGLVWAFPFPIDEIVRLPTKKSNELTITSQTFHRREGEIGKPLSMIDRGPHSALNPSLDGALLTADAGLVHVEWMVTYKINDVRAYVSGLAGRDRDLEGKPLPPDERALAPAEAIIRLLIEKTGIEIASEFTAEEVVLNQVDRVREEMIGRVNERLREISAGIVVETVEMHEPTMPLQVRDAFDRAQQAENAKQKKIREAEQERTKTLNEAAGANYKALVEALDAVENDDTPENRARCEDALMNAEGKAGEMIKTAGAYSSIVVGRMQSDVDQYRTWLPEYLRSPDMLIERLWEQTRERIFSNPRVTKIYVPRGLKEFRFTIPLDPEQRRDDEAHQAREKKFDASMLRLQDLRPVGPEYD